MEFILFFNITPLLILIFLLFLLFAFGIANLICNCIIIFFCIFLLKDIIQEIYALLHIKIGKLFVPLFILIDILRNLIYFSLLYSTAEVYKISSGLSLFSRMFDLFIVFFIGGALYLASAICSTYHSILATDGVKAQILSFVIDLSTLLLLVIFYWFCYF